MPDMWIGFETKEYSVGLQIELNVMARWRIISADWPSTRRSSHHTSVSDEIYGNRSSSTHLVERPKDETTTTTDGFDSKLKPCKGKE
jgi:hypothetical protein